MKTLAACMLILLPLGAMAQQRDKEEGCRQAIEVMLAQVRSLPATTPRDKEDKEKLQSQIEARVKEMRAARKPECEIWGEVGRIASRI